MLSRILMLTFLGIAFVPFNGAHACTAVDVQAKDQTMIAGRTMEWAYAMEWEVIHVPKGTDFSLTAPPQRNLPVIPKKTRYGIVGISPGLLKTIAFIEGQNSEGLGMSGNFLPGFTEYQKVLDTDKHYVSILDFGTWALGLFASVDELKAALNEIKVWYDPSLPSGPTPPDLHFAFYDKTGAGMIIEFIGGEMQIHDNKAHVLTNAPPYSWHLTHLRNYIGLKPVMDSRMQIGETGVTALGAGGNTMALRADYSPASRFIRMAFLRWYMSPPQSGADALQATLHLLNNVDIVKGVAGIRDNGDTAWDETQWIVLKDLTNHRFYIADSAHRTHFVVFDLNGLSKNTKIKKKRVTELPYPKALDVSSALK